MTQLDTIRTHRLNRIQSGQVQPRWSRPDEVDAWERGHSARQSIFAGAVVWFAILGAVGLALNTKNPPAVNSGASMAIAERAPK